MQRGQGHAGIEHVVVLHSRHLGDRVVDVAVGWQVVGDDELDLVVDVGVDLVELEPQQAGVDAELDDHRFDLVGDSVHHLTTLHHRDHISHRDHVLDLDGRQVVDRVLEAGLVPLERLECLVGAVEQTPDLLELSLEPAGVDVDHAHLLRRRHDRHVERPGHPFSSAMAGAGLAGRNRGVGHEVHVRPSDAPAVVGDDDRAVHLGEFGHTLGAERSVDQEATRADRQHLGVVGQHDQCAGLGTNDSIDAVAQRGAWTDPRQGVVHRVVGAPVPTVHGGILVDAGRRRPGTIPGGAITTSNVACTAACSATRRSSAIGGLERRQRSRERSRQG